MSPNLVGAGKGDVVYLKPIEELTALGIKQWKAGDAASRKLNAQRIQVGFILLELKQRIEAGERGQVEWWKWFDENFKKRSRRDAQRLMGIAASDDPNYAYELEKVAQRGRMQDLRARQALAHCAPSAPEPNQDVTPAAEPKPTLTTEQEPETETERDERREAAEARAMKARTMSSAAVIEEAVKHKTEILRLVPSMQPVGRDQFLKALVEDIEALNRKLGDAPF
jgi:hypothetical protein